MPYNRRFKLGLNSAWHLLVSSIQGRKLKPTGLECIFDASHTKSMEGAVRASVSGHRSLLPCHCAKAASYGFIEAEDRHEVRVQHGMANAYTVCWIMKLVRRLNRLRFNSAFR
eukprot:6208547-Pleurochrysis_carterae.AAC.1